MTLIQCALIALLNGAVISLTRAFNGRLSVSMPPLRTSMWNHLVGFFALTPFLLANLGDFTLQVSGLHFWMLTGGLFGCIFVALSSAVFSRLGALFTSLMVIGGQLVFSQVLELSLGKSFPTPVQRAGILLVLGGVALSFYERWNGGNK